MADCLGFSSLNGYGSLDFFEQTLSSTKTVEERVRERCLSFLW
jgi:hypothetical protein